MDDSFQVKLVITRERREPVRQLIVDNTLVVVEFEDGNLKEVYTLSPQGVYGIPSKS